MPKNLDSQAPWVYQAPHTPEGHPRQRYYRNLRKYEAGATSTVELLRFAGSEDSKLTVRVEVAGSDAELCLTLPRAKLLELRDALNDALHEILLEDDERERAASFDRICEEMREADEHGGSRCYYSHPDIHYVAADRVAAKVAELEASGAKFFMVLPEPTVELSA